MPERITLPVPVVRDALECHLLQQDLDALVLPRRMTGAEQPVIGLLARQRSRLKHLGARGVGVAAQVTDQPDLQRVHAGQVTLVGQRQAPGLALRVELAEAALIEPMPRPLHLQILAQFVWRSFEACRQEYGGQGHGALPGMSGQLLQRLARWQSAVVFIEAAQVAAPLLVGEVAQELLPGRIVGIGEQALHGVALLGDVVARDIAHQPDEGEVDRMLECVLDGWILRVFELLEVVEHVGPAAGEEAPVWIGGVAPLHGSLEHVPQAAVRRAVQVGGGPQRQRIARALRLGPALRRRQGCQPVLQFHHDVQVGDQRTQLRGRTQDEFRSGIDIEWLVQIVGMYPQFVARRGALVNQNAVDHLVQPLRRQQLRPDQAQRAGVGGIGKPLQQAGDRALGAVVDGGLCRKVQPVEAVQARQLQLLQQFEAQRVDTFAFGERRCGRRRRIHAETQLDAERGIAQPRRDHALVGQQEQVAVGQGFQGCVMRHQVVRRPPLRQQQAQRRLVGLSERGQLPRILLRQGQRVSDLAEVDAVPCPQTVAQADDLAVSGA